MSRKNSRSSRRRSGFRVGCKLSGSNHPNWNGGKHIGANGYVLVRAPQHPRANAKGVVQEHVLIAERALGRPIPKSAHVHHVNEMPGDNRPSNLVICENQAYHSLLHLRLRALRATGSPHNRHCAICKQWDTLNQLNGYTGSRGNRFYVHGACAVQHTRKTRQNRLERSRHANR
jgi:hypothetical protein